jgi:hypothetical protein
VCIGGRAAVLLPLLLPLLHLTISISVTTFGSISFVTMAAPIEQNRMPCDLPHPTSTASFWHSRPSPLLVGHRSTRELPKTADVVIIGSGMTGASVAYHLLTSPHRSESCDVKAIEDVTVVMLEAREACWGATGRVCCALSNAKISCISDSSRTGATANPSSSNTLTIRVYPSSNSGTSTLYTSSSNPSPSSASSSPSPPYEPYTTNES